MGKNLMRQTIKARKVIDGRLSGRIVHIPIKSPEGMKPGLLFQVNGVKGTFQVVA